MPTVSHPTPIVSVLMPVYNAEPYLRDAVESILNQSFQDFELIVIDDGSLDNSRAILERYRDKRIVRIYKPTNAGIVSALNDGLKVARGKYIARQDADDMSEIERLQIQISFMERNPNVGLVGTQYTIIDADGKVLQVKHRSDKNIHYKWHLLFSNPFIHSSVLFRKQVAQKAGYYYEKDLHAEDYGLWVRVAAIADVAMIGAPLIKYRWVGNSITRKHNSAMAKKAFEISLDNVTSLISLPQSTNTIRLLLALSTKTARYLPSDAFDALVRSGIQHLNRKIIPLLIDNFCSLNYVYGKERSNLANWARNDLASRIESVIKYRVSNGYESLFLMMRLWFVALLISSGTFITTRSLLVLKDIIASGILLSRRNQI